MPFFASCSSTLCSEINRTESDSYSASFTVKPEIWMMVVFICVDMFVAHSRLLPVPQQRACFSFPNTAPVFGKSLADSVLKYLTTEQLSLLGYGLYFLYYCCITTLTLQLLFKSPKLSANGSIARIIQARIQSQELLALHCFSFLISISVVILSRALNTPLTLLPQSHNSSRGDCAWQQIRLWLYLNLSQVCPHRSKGKHHEREKKHSVIFWYNQITVETNSSHPLRRICIRSAHVASCERHTEESCKICYFSEIHRVLYKTQSSRWLVQFLLLHNKHKTLHASKPQSNISVRRIPFFSNKAPLEKC